MNIKYIRFMGNIKKLKWGAKKSPILIIGSKDVLT